MWYGGSVTGGAYAKPDASHWPELEALVTELHELEPVLLGETLASPSVSPADAKLNVLLKRSDTGRVVLFVANRSASEVDAKLTLGDLDFHPTRAEVVGEHRAVELNQTLLIDTFNPYAVHLYELH